MLFNSIDFAFFLPLVLAIYWLLGSKNIKAQNVLIAVSSYVFYGWWSPTFLALIFFSSVVDFTIGKIIFQNPNKPSYKKKLFYLSLFTVVLTKDVSLTFKVMLGVWMTSVVFLWDSAIVFILSGDRVRRKFAKLAYYIDKVTGAILGLVGFKIVKTALTKSSL